MRELHGYHGDHRRHARHAGDAPHGQDRAVDARTGHAPDAPDRDSPEHAARDALKVEMLTNPDARIRASLDYERKVKAAEAAYYAKHAKPGDANLDRPGPEGTRRDPEGRRNLQEAQQELAPPETRDSPAGKIADREKPSGRQGEERRAPERSRLPKTDTVQMLLGNGIAFITTAAVLNLLPDSWEKVAGGIATAVIGNVAWANRRWKEKHGHRPED